MSHEQRKPNIRPLREHEARRSLANRLTRVADNVRQIATRLGARPYRVFLVWGYWAGKNGEPVRERGEGKWHCHREMEILPTPKVMSLDGVSFSIFHAGTVPVGSVKVTEVTTRLTFDELTGRMVPTLHGDNVPDPITFFYEVREDERGDPAPVRQKYRLLNFPTRDAENAQWTLMLEKISEDRNRDGGSDYLLGTQS